MIRKIFVSWEEFSEMTNELAERIIKSGIKFDGIYGIPRGGLILAVCLSHQLNLQMLTVPTTDTLIVDDISDEGKTLSSYKNKKIATLYSSSWTTVIPKWYIKEKNDKNTWIIFPWENKETEEDYSSK